MNTLAQFLRSAFCALLLVGSGPALAAQTIRTLTGTRKAVRTGFALAAVVLSLSLAACGSKTVGTSSDSSPPQNNPSDAAAPSISITSPSTSATYSTTAAVVSLAGSASDNVGVASVSWRNAATGAGGDASGTGSWTVASIALVSGVNTITVTARDAADN